MHLELIQQKIYEIRGQKVMLDFDLAALYEVETRALNQAVKRNIKRFPSDFMFQITSIEWESILSQLVTGSKLEVSMQSHFVIASQKKRNITAAPYCFTEQGVAMLSSILRSDIAINMNIAIMRAFIEIRRIALHHKNITEHLKELSQRIGEHDVQLSHIYDTIENMLDDLTERKSNTERHVIGFKK